MAKRTPPRAPRAFRTPAAFRAWLVNHHATAAVLERRLFKVHAAHGREIPALEALERPAAVARRSR
jgi:hypothetical protein